jgi:predicted SPOUT superfamily RNA methylase MTH1
MAKIKLTKKEIPVLSKDLYLDESVLENLKQLQDSYKAKFEGDIKEAQKQALASYESKIKALGEAKAKIIREHDEEISRYTVLVKEIKGQPTKVPVETKKTIKSEK